MGHTEIAWQDASDIMWKLTDPISGSTRETNQDGSIPSGDEEETRIELAGMGTYVPHTSPGTFPPPAIDRGAWAGDPEMGCANPVALMFFSCTQARLDAEYETRLGISMSNAAQLAQIRKLYGKPEVLRIPEWPFGTPQKGPSSGLAYAAGGSSSSGHEGNSAPFAHDDVPDIGTFDGGLSMQMIRHWRRLRRMAAATNFTTEVLQIRFRNSGLVPNSKCLGTIILSTKPRDFCAILTAMVPLPMFINQCRRMKSRYFSIQLLRQAALRSG